MSRKKKYRAKDKIIHKMTRDGLMEINAATGEEIRVSKRDADFRLRPGNDPERSQIPRTSDAVHNRRRTIPMQGTPSSEIKQAAATSVSPLPTVQVIPDSSKVEPPGRTEEPLFPESSVPNAPLPALFIPCVPGTGGAANPYKRAKLTIGEIQSPRTERVETVRILLIIPQPHLPESRKKLPTIRSSIRRAILREDSRYPADRLPLPHKRRRIHRAGCNLPERNRLRPEKSWKKPSVRQSKRLTDWKRRGKSSRKRRTGAPASWTSNRR